MAKDPSFPFYCQDFLVDTIQMNEHLVGAYVRLLSVLWINGRCHTDAISLARISPSAKEIVELLKEKFTFNADGTLVHNELEKIRAERISYRLKRSESGLIGAKKRWENNSKTDGKHYSKKITKEDEKEDEKEKGKEQEGEVTIYPAFDDFWNLYDKKTDRPKCEDKWQRLDQETKEIIIERLPAYILSTPDKKFRKNPLTYLNNKSWENEIIGNEQQEQPDLSWRKLADS